MFKRGDKNEWDYAYAIKSAMILIFIILIVILLCCLLKIEFDNGLFDRIELLNSTSTILGGYIGFIGAYFIFTFQRNEDTKKKKMRELSELQYKKVMLFNLLQATISKTETIYESLNQIYKEELEKNKEELEKNNTLSENLELDIKIIVDRVSDRTFLNLTHYLDMYFEGVSKLEFKILPKSVYDDKWNDYIDCIPQIAKENSDEIIQLIITWITFLQNNGEIYDNLKSLEFISMRTDIKEIINKIYPEISKVRFKEVLNDMHKNLDKSLNRYK